MAKLIGQRGPCFLDGRCVCLLFVSPLIELNLSGGPCLQKVDASIFSLFPAGCPSGLHALVLLRLVVLTPDRTQQHVKIVATTYFCGNV